MSHLEKINDKIISLEALKLRVENWKSSSEKIVFTNGCFDILHRGHIDVLAKTADLGDKLIIGLNSDSSIRKLKEENRPIVDEKSRALLLAAFLFVDAIVMIGLAVLGVGFINLNPPEGEINPALVFPTVVHVAQTLVAIIMGLVSLLILFLSKKKLHEAS